MTNLEYATIIEELQPLVGARFDKIYKVPVGYRLKIANTQILIQPGIRMHATKYIEDTEQADHFVQKVRAELENSKLISISQINKDRIIEFQFSHASLIFEMFAKGNCILVRDGITLSAMRTESWSDRIIRTGDEYQSPKAAVKESFEQALSDKYVIIALLKLPLGKQYAQEILRRCKIDEKTAGDKLKPAQIKCIEKEIESIQTQTKPKLFLESGKPVDFGLTEFSVYQEYESEDQISFSGAVDQFYWLNKEEKIPKFEKLEKRLSEQQKRLEELLVEEAEFKEKGDYIYSNFEKIQEILTHAGSFDINELEEKLKNYKIKVNKKEKSIELDL
jgi:predicted ribosome quality control (RQC) complex YloA/Tae2 family protein